MLDTAPVLPTQGPFDQPTPVTILTLSLLLNLARAAFWFVFSAPHLLGTLVPGDVGAEDVLETRDVVVLVRVDVDDGSWLVLEVVLTEVVDDVPGTH